MSRGRIRAFAPFLGVVSIALAFGHSRSEAQFGYGFGLGYGLGGFNYRSNQVMYINQKSLLNASRATMGPVSRNVYAGDPNAYFNHIHDMGYIEGYDPGMRREIESRIGRFSDGPSPYRVARRVAGRPGVPVDRQATTPEEVPPPPVPVPSKPRPVRDAPEVRPSPQS